MILQVEKYASSFLRQFCTDLRSNSYFRSFLLIYTILPMNWVWMLCKSEFFENIKEIYEQIFLNPEILGYSDNLITIQ